MNRQLKERIVGATVIVALGIIVIPWLLDGPAQSPRAVEQKLELPRGDTPTRSYSIPLDPAAGRPVQIGGGEPEAADAADVTDAAEPEAAAPAGLIQRPALEEPAAPSPTPRQPEEQPSQPPPRPAPQPAAQPVAQPEATPQAPQEDRLTVQVGSFSQAANAEALRERLVGEGFTAFVSRVATDAGTMHRVRVGPVAERAEAEKLVARLRAAGHTGARIVRAQD
jgi:cell division septation protein DedD